MTYIYRNVNFKGFTIATQAVNVIEDSYQRRFIVPASNLYTKLLTILNYQFVRYSY